MNGNWLRPGTLESGVAKLVPLSLDHHDDLLDGLHDGELWKLWYTYVPTPEGLRAEIEKRSAG